MCGGLAAESIIVRTDPLFGRETTSMKMSATLFISSLPDKAIKAMVLGLNAKLKSRR
jgi:hypothetical protein